MEQDKQRRIHFGAGHGIYKDSEAIIIISADNDKGADYGLPVSELMQGNKFKLDRGLLRGDEGYYAIRRCYEGKKILGPRKKGGQRETA